LRWRFIKDDTISTGKDRAWLDEVVYAATSAAAPTNTGCGFNTGVFGFDIHGASGQSVIVDGSTNLINWLPLKTNTLGSGSWRYNDPNSLSYPKRFYRVRTP